jgi:hypothetical protein
MRPRRAALFMASFTLAMGATAAPARADEIPPVVPFRPTVASPADLPPPGWPEIEIGALRTQGGDDARRISFPVLAKLALTPEFGVAAGAEAHVRRTGYDGERASGPGDLVLAAKRRFEIDDSLAYAIETIVTVPTARPTIGSGKPNLAINGIMSKDFDRLRVDVNLAALRISANDEGTKHWGAGWDVAVSHPIGEAFSASAEVFGSARGGTRASSQALVGMSYSVAPRFVVDVALVAGLARSAPDWQVTCGATIGLPRVF